MLPNSEQPRGCEQERLIRNFLRFLRKADEMEELKLSVPTYNYTLFPTEVELGEKPEFKRFIEFSQPRQREVLGFPPPGHPYWNKETIAAVAMRYPKMDMKPYRRRKE